MRITREKINLPGSARLLVVFLLRFYGNDVHCKCRTVSDSVSGPHPHQMLQATLATLLWHQ